MKQNRLGKAKEPLMGFERKTYHIVTTSPNDETFLVGAYEQSESQAQSSAGPGKRWREEHESREDKGTTQQVPERFQDRWGIV